MNLKTLKENFYVKNRYHAEDLHELLLFVKKSYIRNEISIGDYRSLVKELETSSFDKITPTL
ncbi:YppF family protein [Rossellomorea sp. BNER]|jgi:hypothetical protein|uniref:YppF family protein n=1 Tax=Rossellomorea sp. BNER TaxID=2962031 RepID=UPI003AF1E4E6|nr:YppF family protein [Rossellomorea sp. BNER]